MASATPAVLLNPEVVSGYPVANIIGTSYAITKADVGVWIRTLNAGPVTVTLTAQDAGDSDFPAWAAIYIQKGGTGNVTLVPAGGVTILSSGPLILTEQYSRIELKRLSENVWTAFIAGDVISGAVRFTDLIDVPADYTGFAGLPVLVNGAADGLEFGLLPMSVISGLGAALTAIDNEKVDRAGDTMTGPLVVPDGTLALPGIAIGAADTGFQRVATNTVAFVSAGIERWRQVNGQMVFGNPGPIAIGSVSGRLQIHGNSNASVSLGQFHWNANAVAAVNYFAKSRGTVIGTNAAVTPADLLGTVLWYGDTGAGFTPGARIDAVCAAGGDWATAGNRSADLLFSTISANTFAARFQITAPGNFTDGAGNIIIDANRILRPRSYTIATIPTITPTGLIYVSDLGGGGDNLRSNGTQWLRENRGLTKIASDALAAFAWTYLVSAHTIVLDIPTTAARAVPLSTTNVPIGARVRFVRTAASTGGFAWNIGTGPLKNLAAGAWVDMEFDGAAWLVVGSGNL